MCNAAPQKLRRGCRLGGRGLDCFAAEVDGADAASVFTLHDHSHPPYSDVSVWPEPHLQRVGVGGTEDPVVDLVGEDAQGKPIRLVNPWEM
jgi:hypothetical protein